MRRINTLIVAVIALLLFTIGWFLPLHDYITPREGVGYALGWIGAIGMMLASSYALRKRFHRLFDWIGNQRMIFDVHIIFGIFGPILILYHCGYKLGATNSNVALYSMIAVVASGVIGRYLYMRVEKSSLIKKLFSWWHAIHLPFLGMLIVATIFHILASFMY